MTLGAGEYGVGTELSVFIFNFPFSKNTLESFLIKYYYNRQMEDELIIFRSLHGKYGLNIVTAWQELGIIFPQK